MLKCSEDQYMFSNMPNLIHETSKYTLSIYA